MKKHNLIHVIFALIVLLIVVIDIAFLEYINDSFFVGALIGAFWYALAEINIEE